MGANIRIRRVVMIKIRIILNFIYLDSINRINSIFFAYYGDILSIQLSCQKNKIVFVKFFIRLDRPLF